MKYNLSSLRLEPDGCETSHGLPIIVNGAGHLVASMADRSERAGTAIVNACRAHADLVAALREALNQLQTLQGTRKERWSNETTNMVSAAVVSGRKVLAKAGV